MIDFASWAAGGRAEPLRSDRALVDVALGTLLADVSGASANGGDDVTVGILSRA